MKNRVTKVTSSKKSETTLVWDTWSMDEPVCFSLRSTPEDIQELIQCVEGSRDPSTWGRFGPSSVDRFRDWEVVWEPVYATDVDSWFSKATEGQKQHMANKLFKHGHCPSKAEPKERRGFVADRRKS